eukprot:TRINITY_DN10314_c0_g1_i1.p1 TRINITY_DN10314_c0_g1~~TRINITY_DN10314_c0_g1_i1.p1  ORF type:complete len:420 (+),score=107.88 TRINITY_DN10314_c0_g1_i1:40-1299(+)
MVINTNALQQQLIRLLRAQEEGTKGLHGAIEKVTDAIRVQERKNGRRRIRQPGCSNPIYYGWKRSGPVMKDGKVSEEEDPRVMLTKAMEDVASDRVFQAREVFEKAEAAYKQHTREVQDDYLVMRHYHRYGIEELKRKYTASERVRKEIASDANWKRLSDVQQITTWYRKEGGGWHTAKIEGAVDAPAFELVALLRETDLWHKWIPKVLGVGLQSSEALHVPERTRIDMGCELSLPWPLSNRDLCLYVEAIDALDLEKKQVALLIEDSQKAPPPRNGVVRAHVKESGCFLTPYYENNPLRTYCQFLIRIDVKIETLPSWLLDAVFRNMAFLLLYQIRNAVKLTSHEDYKSRYNHPKSPFYGWLRSRIKSQLPEQGSILPAADDKYTDPLAGLDALLMCSLTAGPSVAAVLVLCATVTAC